VSKKEQKTKKILETALSLFSKYGFYSTTIPDIAKELKMSVGNFYNYFASKETLAKEIMRYSSDMLGEELKKVNDSDITTQEKVKEIVRTYFRVAKEHPQHIDYFLRVYLSNKEIFTEGCEGLVCVSRFVTELMVFFEEGVSKGDLRDQDFFSAFGLFMGYLGGFAFLHGEGVLEKEIELYIDDISRNIYNALKSDAA